MTLQLPFTVSVICFFKKTKSKKGISTGDAGQELGTEGPGGSWGRRDCPSAAGMVDPGPHDTEREPKVTPARSQQHCGFAGVTGSRQPHGKLTTGTCGEAGGGIREHSAFCPNFPVNLNLL